MAPSTPDVAIVLGEHDASGHFLVFGSIGGVEAAQGRACMKRALDA